MGTKAFVEKLPACDLCRTSVLGAIVPAKFDARMKGRTTWAYMCQSCFDQHGVGLGTGLGQELVTKRNNS